MSDNIIPLRPRGEVPRQIRNFRSQPPQRAFCASAPTRIDGSVNFGRLLQGLASVGLAFQHDQRTGEFVILPIAGVQS